MGFYQMLMGLNGFEWVFNGFSMGFNGFYPVFMGFQWVALGFTGFYWVFLGFHWFLWVLMGFIRLIGGFMGFQWVFIGFHECLWVFNGFSWVFNGFHQNCPALHCVRPGVIGFLLDLTGFPQVLPDFCRFEWVVTGFPDRRTGVSERVIGLAEAPAEFRRLPIETFLPFPFYGPASVVGCLLPGFLFTEFFFPSHSHSNVFFDRTVPKVSAFSTEFLPSFYRVFTQFYLVLPSVTQFYLVLPSFACCAVSF